MKKIPLNEKSCCESSLYYFLRQAWPYIEGNVRFIHGWHIKAIAEHLEACYRRDVTKLVINVPPRSGKSNLISVAFPAWVWLHNPAEKFLTASCTNSLSLEIAGKARRLIESNWYQENWGSKFKLLRDQNAKSYYENNKTGYRISTSVGSSVIGKGGDILLADDINNPGVDSAVQRENAKIWWDQVWSTRLNNPKTSVRIVIQQRTHESDISGHIEKNDKLDEWTHLILPNEYEKARSFYTVVNNVTFWEDRRTKEGELLMPARIGEQETAKLKQQLGSYGYAGQYQQRPSPSEGGIIKKSWFRKWAANKYPEFDIILQSWDTAYSDKVTASYSAVTTWGVWYNEIGTAQVMLLSQWRGRVDYPELRERGKRLAKDYMDVGVNTIKEVSHRKPDICLIEEKATGTPLIADLRRANIPAIGYIPKGDKHARVQIITPYIESGIVWLPTEANNQEKFLSWADEFIEAVSSFPNNDSRDLVDTMSQALSYLRDTANIFNPRDEQRESYISKRKILY